MAEGDESAKLWKVNRTIHELVKDRVSILYAHSAINTGSHYLSFHTRALRLLTTKSKWTWPLSEVTTQTMGVASSEFVLNYIFALLIVHHDNISRNQLNFFTNSRANPLDQIFVFFSDERS